MDKRLVRCMVRRPDNVEYLVQLLLLFDFSNKIAIVHVCRKMLFQADHGDIGVLKYVVKLRTFRLSRSVPESEIHQYIKIGHQ